ncbi:uncharacterized protein LOC143046807 [Mytilus galloprovincialis]|uniref:uncharacterized protein LOC143046807 n=1 Tax=Mytilus galloprovincialis TaxID=29158 RepID=UPI003F7C9F7D
MSEIGVLQSTPIKKKMPNKRNAVGSPSRAMGKKRRTTSRTGGKKVQPEEIAQKKDGAGRRRSAKKTKEVGHVVAEVPEETTDISSEEDARVADYIVNQGVSKNTQRSYNLALSKLCTFRSSYKLKQDWPVPVNDLSNFIAFLSVQGLSGGTISSYISGVSYHHKIQGIQDTTTFFIIGKALEGIKRIQGGKRNDIRAPITVQLLSDMISCLDKVCKNKYEAFLFSAVFSVAFFGLLRVGEITTSSVIIGSNLTIFDILVRRKVLELRVRWSKTDQKGKSVTLLIAENGKNYCPVRLINEYLKVRPTCNNTDLFIHYIGMPLTRYQFSSILEKALHFLHISKGHFRSHSFRIGGATELARQGVSEEVIMRLGRWKSHAYSRYIRLQFF